MVTAWLCFFLYVYLSTCNMTSSNVIKWFQTMYFSWLPLVMSLSFIIHYAQHPMPCLAYWDLCTCSISSHFSMPRQTKEDYLMFIHVSLINQLLVICSFTILHTLVQLCFTKNIRDSHRWIIARLNRLVDTYKCDAYTQYPFFFCVYVCVCVCVCVYLHNRLCGDIHSNTHPRWRDF